MRKIDLTPITRRLPLLGIVAFSLCSVNSVANLFLGRAQHPTPALWLAAGLVECVTAWLVYQVVEMTRRVTKSRISKQDRRFYGGALAAFLALAVPSLALSITANTREFGSLFLGVQFPILSVGCAIGAALPDAVGRFENRKERDRQLAERQRKERERERQLAETERKRLETERQRLEREAETERKAAERERQGLALRISNLGLAASTLTLYAETPDLSQRKAAETIGVSERTVRNHLARLENLGFLERNGSGVEVLVELPPDFGENGREND